MIRPKKTLSKLQIQLAKHIPAAQAVFRVNTGFETVISTLSKLKPPVAAQSGVEDVAVQGSGDKQNAEDGSSAIINEEKRIDLINSCFDVLDVALLSNLNRKFFDVSGRCQFGTLR
jgi:hypothetical protein